MWRHVLAIYLLIALATEAIVWTCPGFVEG